MLKFPATTAQDHLEASKLRRRQVYEDKRKERIFNAKQRCFGVDMKGLEQQIIMKNKIKAINEECERRFQAQAQMQQRAVYAKEVEERKHQAINNADINAYRCKFQRLDQRREFDLNDPDKIKKAKPLRSNDDDINLGVSSAQVFAGEDLGNCERRLRQRMQQKAWLDQQLKERRCAREANQIAQDAMVESLKSRDRHLDKMAEAEQNIREYVTLNTRDYNFKLAAEKREKAEKAKAEQLEDDMAEIYNMMTSDMLTENPDVAQSKTHPNKKVAIMYRGMTPEELHRFRQDQYQQMLLTNQRKTQRQLMDKQWEQYTLNMDRELVLKQIDLERKRKMALDEQLELNAKLAAEQRERRETEKKQRTNNRIGEDFYDQFNTTTR